MNIQFFSHADNQPGLIRAMKDWPDEWDDELRRLMPTTTNCKIAQVLGASPGLVGFRIKKLGLVRSDESMKLLYSDIEGRLKMGVNQINQQAAGTIKWIKKHKNRPAEKPEWWIFLGKGERMPLRRHLWLTWIGPIPKGHNIIFVDHNPRRCLLSNLECIPNGEMAKRNRNLIKMSLTNRNNWASPKGEERKKRHSLIMRKFFKSEQGIQTLAKRTELIKQMYAEGLINNPFRRLDDNIIAYYLSQDPEMRQYILDNEPELIDLKRTQLLLNRAIKQHEDES